MQFSSKLVFNFASLPDVQVVSIKASTEQVALMLTTCTFGQIQASIR
jgi:hypothetical protein